MKSAILSVAVVLVFCVSVCADQAIIDFMEPGSLVGGIIKYPRYSDPGGSGYIPYDHPVNIGQGHVGARTPPEWNLGTGDWNDIWSARITHGLLKADLSALTGLPNVTVLSAEFTETRIWCDYYPGLQNVSLNRLDTPVDFERGDSGWDWRRSADGFDNGCGESFARYNTETGEGIDWQGNVTYDKTSANLFETAVADLISYGGPYDAGNVRHWDATELVQKWMDGTWENRGFVVWTPQAYPSDNEELVGQTSAWGRCKEPELTIQYMPFLRGDANTDNKVDGGDLALWQQNYDPLGSGGDNNTWGEGNWNGDNSIDGGDLALWQQNYAPIAYQGGGGAPLGLNSEVPEPATMLLIGTGLLGSLTLRRRRLAK